jgi:hypothetical protein
MPPDATQTAVLEAGAPPANPAGAPSSQTPGTTTPGQQGQGQPQVPPQPAKLFAGKYKTPEDLERAYLESHAEVGRRLSTWEAEKQTFTSKLEELQAELSRRQPAFKELSQEELTKLRSEEPASYTEYLLQKRDYDARVEQDRQARGRR